MATTRGIRNNNPANIKRSSTRWAYMRSIQSDNKFVQFTEMKYGIRAFFILMRTYRYKYGLKTPSQIIDRFAPSSENDTNAYKNFFSSRLIDIDKPIRSDLWYCIFAKYVFRYESLFICSTSYLVDILSDLKLKIINPKLECDEIGIF